MTGFADENVGDTTPLKGSDKKMNASENLTQSHYLSSSFQNSKRDSKLKQILQMSLTNIQGMSSSSNRTLVKRLEEDSKLPPPQLMTQANKPENSQQEKANYRVHPQGSRQAKMAAMGSRAAIASKPAMANKVVSPSKLSRANYNKRDPA